jgi:hypothetical protein
MFKLTSKRHYYLQTERLYRQSGILTNRGLIDGSDTFINAHTVNNIGTGSVFGDHLVVQANALLNDTETLAGNTELGLVL